MRILIAGASGMIGQSLIHYFPMRDLILVGRDKQYLKQLYPQAECINWQDLNQIKTKLDTIIHLSGENIGHRLWTKKQKDKIMDSRETSAAALVAWANKQQEPIHILASNAIGYYGTYPDHHSPIFTEDAIIDEEHPSCFLQQVCISWQKAYQDLNPIHHLSIMRFGVVLKKNQGMLKKLEPSFYLGLGAIIGNGSQYISWIHIEDLCRAIVWLSTHQRTDGVYNLTAPEPVNQRRFAQTLSKILNRPLFFKLANILIQAMFQEMGRELLIQGQYVLPKKLIDQGFIFHYPSIEAALKQLYKK